MTADEYREAIEALGLTVLSAGRFLDVNERTARRWANGELSVPPVVAMLLTLMVKYSISVAEAYELFGQKWNQK